MTHTPGPWIIGKPFKSLGNNPTLRIESARSVCGECGRSDGSWVIADTYENAVPKPQHKANARLIAAAPDMLAALKAIMDAPWRPEGMREDHADAARAAIAKATTP